MAAYQNAAKRLKALLRRTHFPVSRLKQIRGSSVSGSGCRDVGSGAGNPWVSIVDGDPRAALVVLHWTLLDMSQLFSSNLLDRGYAGLHSLTDYKFVSKCLRMLREEFDCRSQLTAEQFLTQGFAEVKMRLLADIVEVVIRTHTSLSKLQGGGNSVSSQKPKPSVSADTEVSVGTGSGWGVGSDVLRTGPWPLYPWANPTPISLPSSRTGSVDSRDSGGDQLSDSSARPRSPPRLSGGPMSIGSSRSCGSIGEDRRQPTTLGSSNLNDEQNAPSLTAPAPSHTCVAPYHWLADRPPASYYSANAGAAAAVDDVPANGGGATLWLQDPECFKRLRESVMHGPRSAQYSFRESSTEAEVEAATTMRHDAAAAVYNHGRDRPDWHAVQQALGSLDEFQVPSSPPAVVPSSPSTETGVPRLAPPPMSSTLTPRTDASSKIPAESSAFRGDGAGSGTINPLGRGFSRTSGTSYEPEESLGGIGCGDTGQDHDKCWGELSKLKQQIKAMLDQHMRLFESKIKDTEQVLSARLTLLETKVQGLEVGSPVHS